MSYTTQYGVCRYDKQNRPQKHLFMICIAVLFAAIILLQIAFPAHVENIRSVLFPFMAPNVQEAFSEMVGNLRSGTDFSEAAVVFCREVLYEGLY